MREFLIQFTEYATIAIDILALVLVIIGTIEAFIGALRLVISGPAGPERREIWLRYARWLVAALTFQLAADIVETSTTADWDTVGRLAAIAVVRTFLNYFLERDLADVRELQQKGQAAETSVEATV